MLRGYLIHPSTAKPHISFFLSSMAANLKIYEFFRLKIVK